MGCSPSPNLSVSLSSGATIIVLYCRFDSRSNGLTFSVFSFSIFDERSFLDGVYNRQFSFIVKSIEAGIPKLESINF